MLKRDEIGVLSGQLVPIGELVAADSKEATPPSDIQILPYPSWETDYGTLVTDEKAQELCVDYFNKRRTKLVIDYEHQTTKGVEAPAAGWIPKGGLYAAGEEGLRAKNIDWRPRAAGYLANKEYEYHSPVALFEKKSKRVCAILSIALTNTPATQDQTPLSEQIAAKAIAEYEQIMGKGVEGGFMKSLIESLRYTLGMRVTDTVKDLKASLQKVMDALGKLDDKTMIVETKEKGEAAITDDEAKATLLELLGLVAKSEAGKESKTIVASTAVCDLIGVKHDADLATISAAVLQLKHPADMVSKAEYDKVVAKLADLDKATAKEQIELLITKGKEDGQITPALEPEIRQYAEKQGIEAARAMVAKLPVQKPSRIAGGDEPPAPKDNVVAMKVKVGAKELSVSAESAQLTAKIEAFQRENKIATYPEAARRYYKEAQ